MRTYQTKQAETGVRVRKAQGLDVAGDLSERQKKVSEKLALMRQFNEVLRKYQADTVAIGTGMVRKAQ